MKNENIHNWLSDKEVRDFLAKNVVESQILGSIEMYEREFERAKKDLEKCKKYEAVKILIEKSGWKKFDISDEIGYNENTYFPFVGTEDEYKELIAKINKDKEDDKK